MSNVVVFGITSQTINENNGNYRNTYPRVYFLKENEIVYFFVVLEFRLCGFRVIFKEWLPHYLNLYIKTVKHRIHEYKKK